MRNVKHEAKNQRSPIVLVCLVKLLSCTSCLSMAAHCSQRGSYADLHLHSSVSIQGFISNASRRFTLIKECVGDVQKHNLLFHRYSEYLNCLNNAGCASHCL